MREILFKAKRMDNGEWVQGYIVRHPSAVQIGESSPWYIHVPPIDPDDSGGVFNVNPETVCQYTGLTDKNGVRIFEGDFIKILGSNKPALPAPVIYFQEQCQFAIKRGGYNPVWLSEFDPKRSFEVIGNIHDKEADHGD